MGGLGFGSPSLPPDLETMKKSDPEKFAQLSCFANPLCKGLLRSSRSIAHIDLSQPKSTKTKIVNLCFGSELDKPSYPQITNHEPQTSKRCCSQVKMDEELASSDQGTLNSALIAQLFFQNLKDQIQNGKAPSNLDAFEKMAWLIQSYNGRGKFPSWEKNKCLAGLDMGKTLIYGATISDIMVNMLIANPYITEIVNKESKKENTSQKSLICTIFGAGEFKINSQKFADLEKKFLSGDSGMPDRLKICSSGQPSMSFQPWTEIDARTFFSK